MAAPYQHSNPFSSGIRRQVWGIITSLSALCIIVLFLGLIQASIFDGIRGFVKGEGHWAKAQKDAIYYLQRYVAHSKQQDYEQFLNAIEKTQGARHARLALEKDSPNLDVARKGFLKSDNHPDDIELLINFYLRYQDFYHVKKSTEIWKKADKKIDELRQLGEEIYDQGKEQRLSTQQRQQIDTLNSELTTLENDFSQSLNQGSQWIRQTTFSSLIIIVTISLLFVFYYMSRVFKQINNNERALLVSEKRFNSLFESKLIAIIEWNKDGTITAANTYFHDLMGYSPSYIGKKSLNWASLIPTDQQNIGRDFVKQMQTDGINQPYEIELHHSDGHRVSVYLGGLPYSPTGESGLCFAIDQTEKKRIENQYRLAATVLENSHEGIVVLDRHEQIMNANEAFCRMMGCKMNKVVGHRARFFHNGVDASIKSKIRFALQKDGYWQGDSEVLTKDEKLLPIRLSISRVNGSAIEASTYVAIYSDISEQKALEAKLKNLAHYDYLTGLANRPLFENHLNQNIARAQRNKSQFALLFIDLNRFKPINDQYGHEVGDDILKQVAKRLTQNVRQNDVIARLGGDEFVMIVEGFNNPSNAQLIAAKIIENIAQPYRLQKQEISLGCSIGISIYPNDGANSIELTRSADIAMYAAKSRGDNQFYFFNPAYQDSKDD
ncbi:diguanylate cyclase domain-containing protein [Bermanella sp. R86510]|uniref:diguanylate cyclase domain-containing protein n=1 Tax=unclassified Bermanella TaxID=2627862 RepID=UPI0037CC1B64